MKYSKIAIIGAGAVGSTTAYSLMLSDCAAEIVLIDIDEKRCKGEILDLSDALSFCETSRVREGSADDAKDSDIVIIAAGKPQAVGQNRSGLVEENKKIISNIFKSITPLARHSIVIVVTNPVDVLTLHAQTISGLPRSQVFGSGTLLDTQRLRSRIAKKIGVSEQSVDAYILGEHGDFQFPVWSSARAGGVSLLDYPGVTQKDLEAIAEDTRNAVYEIIRCKGATYYGIASCITVLCKAVLLDQKLVVPISCYQEQFGVCLSVPVVLGRNGIETRLSIGLNEKEQEQLEYSVEKIRRSS